MKIAIIGTGGVGGYFGGKLAKAGYDVTFLARGEHLKAIQQHGLRVKSIHGDFIVNTVKVTDTIKNIGPADFIILAVKAWQINDIVQDLTTIIKRDSLILPLMNGVSSIDELKEKIDPKNLIAGLCRIISKIESPGLINHFGVEPSIVFGESDNTLTERVKIIKDIFDKTEIKARISDDIMVDVWKKFIPICVSGLLAVSKTNYGELRELRETRHLMTGLLKEAYDLSQKIGIKIEPDFLGKAIAFIDSFPYESTSSLTRDVLEGKPSEIEYQNGTIVRLAEKYGIETPINRFVYYCILPMEIKARKQWNLR